VLLTTQSWVKRSSPQVITASVSPAEIGSWRGQPGRGGRRRGGDAGGQHGGGEGKRQEEEGEGPAAARTRFPACPLGRTHRRG